VKEGWGTSDFVETVAPSLAHDEAFRQWYATLARLGASPRAVCSSVRCRAPLTFARCYSRIAAPTLVMHRTGDGLNSVEAGRYLAERIPGARWLEMTGDDFAIWSGDLDALAGEVEEFLTDVGAQPNRRTSSQP
jgi:pimeloyl-ACP methyl ester carboxylesterase